MKAASPHLTSVSAQPLLKACGLSVSHGSIPALIGVELTIAPGQVVAFAGEPGSGKTTLVRCLAGELVPDSGSVLLEGRPLVPGPDGSGAVALVWQDLELCDNLDIAGNLLLGRETPRLMLSPSRFHAAAAALLGRVRIPLPDTTRLVGSLGGAQRQLLALAKALAREPRVLVLDEPTAALGAAETAHVEGLIASLGAAGTTVLVATRDVAQSFRVADRIVVLRQGRVVADLDPTTTHPDDVVALASGQEIDLSARRQLTRLHGLADRLVSADPSSSLSLIVSALGGALGSARACIHVRNGRTLACAASLGCSPEQVDALARLAADASGGPPGRTVQSGEPVVVAGEDDWRGCPAIARDPTLRASWSFPVAGSGGVGAVLTVFRDTAAPPQRDELDLLSLYAGYAAAAVERDRLLEQVTARNRVLETIREILQILAGPVVVQEGLASALGSLRRGLQAAEAGLLTRRRTGGEDWRAYAGAAGSDLGDASAALAAAARLTLARSECDGVARPLPGRGDEEFLAVAFSAPAGPAVLVARWSGVRVTEAETALMEDAAHSLNLALEREEAATAHQEAAALRRSRELQRDFLSRLSHELRTPLTAIRGYASSLLAPDVTWDGDSEERFLARISAESARLGRLVDDLLDFSAIESGVMRLQRDWCELPLVIEAAVACLPGDYQMAVSIEAEEELPVVWADHDRLEQLFVNLLGNALRHNPPGTSVRVRAARSGAGSVEIEVSDDGVGLPSERRAAPFDSTGRARSPSAGAGLGLSIARGIVAAHRGKIELQPTAVGTTFRIGLPVEAIVEPAPLVQVRLPASLRADG